MTDLALAVDLGGTKVEAALVDDAGAVVPGTRHRRPTGPDVTPDRLQAALIQVVRGAARNADGPVRGIGIGSAGPIDHAAGTIAPVNMTSLHGMPLRDVVADAAARAGLGDVPVCLGHDGGCLALAESWVGVTREARVSLAFVVSTGIGGGFLIDGRLFAGTTGNAGHLGQMHSDGGLSLEQVASGPASVAWARAQGWAGDTGEELAQAAASGHTIARAAVERSAGAIGRALADIAALVDVEVFAVGGGFSHVAEDYVELIGAALRDAASLAYARAARVVRSGLGGDGPLIGAAALVLRSGS
ncbi:ROK family protein [Microbacterium protaetiae]|uniref:ROK family protein n=1 Tax=Microbacterium protaetiae TaxID=2509458 RepID=A0A4P6EDH7_9MICO|nr:ROK family protein [Microbacterium protaetiae]QAY59363.1 ROK family protein [Microbacterium protaetiae]